MKLKFDPSLQFQQDAIQAVVGVFAGQAIADSGAVVAQPGRADGLVQGELGLCNNLTLSDDALLANTRKTQEAYHIERAERLRGRNFSVEMETGTGKTYVYLRTLFELNRTYGFRKFIIVAPSVAVREGVIKSVDMMAAHFRGLYDNAPFDCFVYDSKRLGKVRQFAVGNQIQIMVINIQSFVKDDNVINRENDRMSGRSPIEFIQATKPFVVIDEPQSVDNTAKARRAIERLGAAAILRYSATHRDPYNLLYKLDPVRAYDMRLVKRIEVASIRADDNLNEAYVRLLKTDNKRGVRAQVEFHRQSGGGPRAVKAWVRQGDDLFVKSGERHSYKEGYIVQHIDCAPGSRGLEFNSGRWLEVGQAIGGYGDEIMRAQVRETVEQHLKKERALKGRGVKALSLFFIDKVANYRVYHDDGGVGLGKIGRWFEEAYTELTAKPRYRGLIPHAAADVHSGYFSRDKRGRAKDTRGDTREDEDTYNLIMRDKERLLDEAVPLRFIFSHSALREGWDNPNVFQICTLNETWSADKKRQEIGRGLRLAVNRHGERVHDDNVNRLTVVANESYEEFARALQTELEEDFGIRFGMVDKIACAGLTTTTADGADIELGQDGSGRLWRELVANGYLSEAGEILDAFDPADPRFELKVSDEFAGLRAQIIDEINKRVFKNRVADARQRREVKFRKEVQLSDDFKSLWERIKHRTRYRVVFATDELIAAAVARVKKLDAIKPPRLAMTRVYLDITDAGVDAGDRVEDKAINTGPVGWLPDVLSYLQKETELTRHTLFEILRRCGRLGEFRLNPHAFMSAAGEAIGRALRDLTLDGIRYDKIDGRYWEMSRIEREAERGIVRYLSNLHEVKNKNKALFTAIECDSEVERRFAADLDANEYVRLFVKLPAWFKVDTPVGPYNPDWAFVTCRDEKLYFVRETKSALDSEERRARENQKIACGKRHFAALGMDFDVVTQLAEVDI